VSLGALVGRRSERGARREAVAPREQAGPGGLDGRIAGAAGFLVAMGIVMIYSATAPLAMGHAVPPHFVRHLIGVAGGLVLGALAMRVPLAAWRRWALPAWLLCVMLLVATALFGARVNGAKRWLVVPGTGLSFQPAELAKLATLLAVAAVLARHDGPVGRRLRDLVPVGLLAAIPAGLLLLQPDLGNAALILVLCGLLVFLAGAPLRWMLLPALLGIAGVVLYVSLRPYALRRWVGFLHPWDTASSEGFQLVQSFVAFGRGGLLGVGLGAGRQKLFYLPEAHTDFILSVVAEELGLVGVLLVLGAFAALLLAGLRVARRCSDRFALFLSFAMTMLLTLPAAMNAAVVTGLIPTKGLALPFLSYGRTQTIVCLVALGILLGVARREGAGSPHAAPAARRSRSLR
jgi:cell division protein FtsW